jgi:selenide,water dikinase
LDIKLTHHARFGGCAAKIGPGDLSDVLCGIDIPEDPDVIVGLKGFEDAGVYRLGPDLAIVQTVDFFTPHRPQHRLLLAEEVRHPGLEGDSSGGHR